MPYKSHYRVFCRASSQKSKKKERAFRYSEAAPFRLDFIGNGDGGGDKTNEDKIYS